MPNCIFSFIVLVFSFQLSSSYSVNCLKDEDLSDVQNYAFTLPEVKWDASYWNNEQYSFYAYGKMDKTKEADEATTISAKFLTAKGELIYSTTVNCDDRTWKNMVTDPVTGEETEDIAGELHSPCMNSENIVDLIFKVNNAYMMSWIFNGEALQTKTQIVEKVLSKVVVAARIIGEGGRVVAAPKQSLGFYVKKMVRPLKVPTKSHAYKGAEMILKTTGKAVLTRIVFGQCNSWPKEYTMQCQKAKAYVTDRSKQNVTAILDELQETLLKEGIPESDIEAEMEKLKEKSPDAYDNRGLGTFGNNLAMYSPACFLDSDMFDHLTAYVHPDRFNVRPEGGKMAEMYACCTDMATGLIWDEVDSKPQERTAISSKHCTRTKLGEKSVSAGEMFCEVSRDERLVKLAINENN